MQAPNETPAQRSARIDQQFQVAKQRVRSRLSQSDLAFVNARLAAPAVDLSTRNRHVPPPAALTAEQQEIIALSVRMGVDEKQARAFVLKRPSARAR